MSQEIRTLIFVLFFSIFSIWEMTKPKKKLTTSKSRRWFSNLSLIFIGNIAIKTLTPWTALEAAEVFEKLNLGLFNNIKIPWGAKFFLSIILLDLAIYAQHVVFHKVPTLWKIHKVHHADTDIDLSTSLRFHPFEIFLSLLIKISIILTLGISPFSVFIFEIILNSSAMFNHSNITLSKKIDKFLRKFLVTPDMHKVHHSIYLQETNSNYGFNIAFWDRIFGTYCEKPKDGYLKMTIGLKEFRNKKYLSLFWILVIPFIRMDKNEEHKPF